ncbi:MAG: TonB-dependent receptor [Steroidobacteraceae bacterium]|nr:TonB-dependent receptor [Steroidobacteraceae bacterium]
MNSPRPSRNLLLAAAVAAALPAPAALAQQGSAAIEEIVVTARRTEESLQSVPVAVSAFSEATLERIGAVDSTGLQGMVPNLNIVQGRGSSNATNIYIRGVGQPDALQTFDPAVGFYVDEVYFSRIRGTQLDLYDIERVEVLRGPQGTLYGKNTIGGALNVVTRRPGQEPYRMVQITAGDYDQIEGRLSLAGPLTETLAGSVAVLRALRDGYVTNPDTGAEYNDRDARAARVALAWDPSDNVSVDWAADYNKEDNALVLGQPINTLTTLFGVPILVLPADVPKWDFKATPTPGLPNSQELEHWGTSLNARWDISESLSLKSITAYRKLDYIDYIDIDATTLETGDVLVDVDQDQVSQELQATWQRDRLTMVGGVYYLQENIESHQEAFADDLLTGPGGFTFLRTIDDDLTTTSWAAYVNASYALTDRLNFGLGVRYTDEEKKYDRSTSTFSTFPGLTQDPAFAFKIKDNWTDTSPMASVDFQATGNILLYARYAEGFKSGGFNGRANNPGEQAPYDPEEVTSYEIGLKSDWMDRTLRANVALFYNDYTDFQARVSGIATDPGTGLPSPELTVLNAGELEIYGAELELSYMPMDALLLDLQVGYLDAEYKDFDDVRFTNFGGSRAFQAPAFSPEWTGRLGATYTLDLGDTGSLRFAGSTRFRSRMALAIDNTFTNTDTEIEGLFQDDYWLYDASVLWTDADGGFSVGVYGKNLADEVYRTDGQEFSSVGNIRTVYYGAPRTFSIVATLRF